MCHSTDVHPQEMIATGVRTVVLMYIISQTEITSLEISSLGICSEGNGYIVI